MLVERDAGGRRNDSLFCHPQNSLKRNDYFNTLFLLFCNTVITSESILKHKEKQGQNRLQRRVLCLLIIKILLKKKSSTSLSFLLPPSSSPSLSCRYLNNWKQWLGERRKQRLSRLSSTSTPRMLL